jgi:hypothetical protein
VACPRAFVLTVCQNSGGKPPFPTASLYGDRGLQFSRPLSYAGTGLLLLQLRKRGQDLFAVRHRLDTYEDLRDVPLWIDDEGVASR